MNFIVMNFSGNVGKSTVSKHLLESRLPKAKLISVESINSDDIDGKPLRGKEYSRVLEELQKNSHTIVDVGASNVEDFLDRMSQYTGSHEDFDFFLVPTVPTKKQQTDTLSTLVALQGLGVPGDKIRVVFNRLEKHMNVSDEFPIILECLKVDPEAFSADPSIFIRENDVYGLLEGQNLSDVANDLTNFRQKMSESTTQEERMGWAKRQGLMRLARGAKAELDEVFRRLLPEVHQ